MAKFQARKENTRRSVSEAFTASIGLGLFAFFINIDSLLVLLSAVGLIVTVLAITSSFLAEHGHAKIFGIVPFSLNTVGYMTLGVVCISAFSVSYRLINDVQAFPNGLGRFALVAAAIGATEELVFRGYIQGRLRPLGWAAAILFTTAVNTTYKLTLHAFPPEGISIDYTSLAFLTIIGGLSAGILRELSGSVLPPAAAHIVSVILVYGENTNAPWWVW
jgi:membrane protease YdiL (CAAX protease family)